MSTTVWKPRVPWLWVTAVAVPTGYVMVLLVAWCARDVAAIGWDARSPILVGAAVAPFGAWPLAFRWARSPWPEIRCRALFATAVAGVVSVAALFVPAGMTGGM